MPSLWSGLKRWGRPFPAIDRPAVAGTGIGRTPKSEARFRVAIPEPRFEKCCFWRKDDMLHARSVPTSKSFLKVMENQGVMAWSALLLFFFRLQRGLGGYKTFDCPRRTAKSRTGFCTLYLPLLFFIIITICYLSHPRRCEPAGEGGRGQESGWKRALEQGRYKSLAAVGRVGLGVWPRSFRCVFRRRDSKGRSPLAAGGFSPMHPTPDAKK